jgi:hypothetical protein
VVSTESSASEEETIPSSSTNNEAASQLSKALETQSYASIVHPILNLSTTKGGMVSIPTALAKKPTPIERRPDFKCETAFGIRFLKHLFYKRLQNPSKSQRDQESEYMKNLEHEANLQREADLQRQADSQREASKRLLQDQTSGKQTKKSAKRVATIWYHKRRHPIPRGSESPR